MEKTKAKRPELVAEFRPENKDGNRKHWCRDTDNSLLLNLDLVDAGGSRYSELDGADVAARNVVIKVWHWNGLKKFDIKPVAHDVLYADYKKLEKLTKLVKGLDSRIERASVIKDLETQSEDGPKGYKNVHEALIDAFKACSIKRVIIRHRSAPEEAVSVLEFYTRYLKEYLDDLQEWSGALSGEEG